MLEIVPGFRGGRTRRSSWHGLGSLLGALVVVTAVACGSSDDSDGGSDGDGDAGSPSSTGGKASGGTAGSSDGGGTAGTSDAGGNTGNDAGAPQGPNEPAPGDFGAVWRFKSAEVSYIDVTTSQYSEPTEVEFPNSIELPKADGTGDVELYLQFKGDRVYYYAYYAGDSAYYELSQPATQLDEEGYVVSSTMAVHSYTLEDGVLKDSSTGYSLTGIAYAETTFEKLDGDFPPDGWPTESVEHAAGVTP